MRKVAASDYVSHIAEVAVLDEDEYFDKVSVLVIGGMMAVSIASALGVRYWFWATVLQYLSD